MELGARTIAIATLVLVGGCGAGATPSLPTSPSVPPTSPAPPSGPVSNVPSGFEISDAEITAAASMPGLTDEQRAAVRQAFEDARVALADVRARLIAEEISPEEARAEAQRIQLELLAKLETILPSGGVFPFDFDLTWEQRLEIFALRLETLALVVRLHAQVEGGTLNGEEARAVFQAHVLEMSGRICAVLTPEQRARHPACQPG